MTPRARSWLIGGGLLLVAVVLLAGPRGGSSSRPPIHLDLAMDAQPRAEPQAASDFFYDGKVLRPPVAGTVARGELPDGSPFATGMDPAVGFVAENPLSLDDATRERGRRRYEIYCGICHDESGDGRGLLFERAQVKTPTYHSDRLRQVPDGYLFAVISNGFGLMPSYAYPIPPTDRWAIVAHVRELQARRLERDAPTPGGSAP
jgi:mono/diheme cytochrome c family protein